MAAAAARIESIFIYPVKSCRGISVSQAPIVPTGFLWDRHWMVINSKGRACTQRVEPRLALVEVELPSEAFSVGWKPTKSSYLVIRAPAMDDLKVSLNKPCEKSDGVTVWEWTGSVLDEGAEASKWFSDFIGKPSRLVRFNEEYDSRPLPTYAPTPGYNLVFTDQYQFLMLSQGSLDALNNQLEEPLPVNRFRPSILIDGCEPFAEDLWKEIKINNMTFLSIQLCPRCKVPLVNQENGIPGSEPNETLMKFRSDKILELSTKHQGKVYFGQGLVCSKDSLNGVGGIILKVGDTIHVDKVFASYADAIA